MDIKLYVHGRVEFAIRGETLHDYDKKNSSVLGAVGGI